MLDREVLDASAPLGYPSRDGSVGALIGPTERARGTKLMARAEARKGAGQMRRLLETELTPEGGTLIEDDTLGIGGQEPPLDDISTPE